MTLAALAATLLMAGLLGSLHCIGMCGPILVGFSQAFARGGSARSRLSLELAAYHAGRLWTYALLGALAGIGGRALRDSSSALGWQRPASFAASAIVIATGLGLLGALPGLRLGRLASACGFSRLASSPMLGALLHSRALAARLLLGAVMGLLPCGLVYGALSVAAADGRPLHGALAMLAFGLGTLPSLSAALVAARAVPPWLRLHGSRAAALAIIATGCWMLARSALVTPGAPAACHTLVGVSAAAQAIPELPDR